MPPLEWDFRSLFDLLGLIWVCVVSPAAFIYFFFIRKPTREKPDNYIGKFRRPDGLIIHVARMPSGELWACTEEPPGVTPQPVGYVTGREVMTFHKLSTAPDGQDCVPRPD